MKDLRKVEVLINNEWVERDFAELRKGVKFKMFEPTGEPVVDNEGETEWIAISDPFKTESGVWAIEIDSREAEE